MSDEKKLISSVTTIYFKKIFPIFWFGFLGFFLFVAISSFLIKPEIFNIMFFIVPSIMGLFGFIFFKKLLFPLRDKVFDCGDYLIIRNKGKETKITFSEIRNISYNQFFSPNIITLNLKSKDISFIAQVNLLSPYKKSKAVKNLIEKVYEERK